jgi:L-glyceraldehyde 3-phosphate reductase
MPYTASADRYESMSYRRCGRSGLKLPLISLGLWHNFGDVDTHENSRAMLLRAFDLGITHFDIANNYGPPGGSAERTFGRVLKSDLAPYRDELVISSKAGYYMWPGPYGDFASRKYLVASIDQSLKRTGLDYFDIFYSHRPDKETPVEETMAALDHIVRSGRALYVGISSYDAEQTAKASRILRELGTPCLIHQPSYSMLNRWIERDLLGTLERDGIGCIPFCPLAQGLLTDRYLDGSIPVDSRAAKAHGFLRQESITVDVVRTLNALNEIAVARGQSLAQMALAWVLRDERVTSALIGASRVEQIEQDVAALESLAFSGEELAAIDNILG